MQSKAEFRDRLNKKRRELTPQAYREESDQIVATARQLPEVSQARVVHTYWPRVDDHEPDIRPLIYDFLERNVKVILPIVEVFSRATTRPRLSHVEYTRDTKMTRNRWGIMEPENRGAAAVDNIDLILVPALACDVKGLRIGHGFGYYDEFLATTPGVRLCLCMDPFLVDALPADPHDQRMDIIVTGSQIIRPQRSNMP
ncbi:MAG: 5-formyltetrahydrofolate cyclo-ligase [Rhodothermales bacterium]|nr:5-formyltetrahydrofolate cyclo-ligase [Rhodothermales bacterium]